MTVNCYDIASMVIDETTRQYEGVYVVSEDKLGKLKEQCDQLDILLKKNPADSIDAALNEVGMTVVMVITLPNLIINPEEYNGNTFPLCKHLEFVSDEDGYLNIVIEFESVWEEVDE